MPARHRLLALLVAALWGVNFLAIDASLAQFPPLFLVAVRFTLLAVPTLLFVRPPRVPWRWVIGYGLGFGVAQFAFLYLAMTLGMPPGLASLVLQASAPFTVLLGVLLTREQLGLRAGLGVTVAVGGLAVVGLHRAENAALLPFLLTLLGALGWAVGNLCTRQARTSEPLRLVLWMSVVPPLPALVLSLLLEGPGRITASLDGIGSATGVLALLGLAYTVVIATLLASGIWSWLMSRHPAGSVAPFSMLVPVVGMTAAAMVLGERAAPAELLGAVLVVGGVVAATWAPRRRALRGARRDAPRESSPAR
ncbi:EamA family transporter [Brachybacterium sp. AOP43-C2-M15]|uniref:EamA family transporter n=1 Tax=Brachybacterium sp. AOP43-C2-M15 TaxID=3457661 RepID=UPI00403465FB